MFEKFSSELRIIWIGHLKTCKQKYYKRQNNNRFCDTGESRQNENELNPNCFLQELVISRFLEITKTGFGPIGRNILAFKCLSKMRYSSGLKKFSSLLFFGGLIHESMNAIQRLLLILADFRSFPRWIAGDIISVHNEIEISIWIHSPYLQEDNTPMFDVLKLNTMTF